MTRLVFLLLAALLAAAGWFVVAGHGGDPAAAWAAVAERVAAVTSERGGAPAAGREAADDGEAPRPARRGGERAPTPVVTATAEAVDLPILRASVGWVEPIATVTVRARIDGEVIEQRVRDGQMVEAGDLLFRLDNREIAAQIAQNEAAIARDEAALAKARGDLGRSRELLARKVVSQAQLDQASADEKVAAANLAASKAALTANRVRLGYTTVTAPISGRVGIVRVTEGNLVRGSDNTGDGLLTITQMKPLRVDFTLPERDLGLLRAALRDGAPPAPVELFADPEATEPVATGRLAFVDSSVDRTSGTIQAKALVDNEDGALWPGQYVRVAVELGTRPDMVTVPLVAVQPGQDGTHVFVAENGRVRLRRVEVAETRGEIAAIASGLKAGERVVVEGQLRLQDGTRVTETPAAGPSPQTAEAEAGTRRR